MAIIPARFHEKPVVCMRTLLKLLADGEFHSGEVLGQRLGVSRAAVWKQLIQLQEELGLDIHKVRGKGYRLPKAISLLDVERLQLACGELGWAVSLFDTVGSTNSEAMRLASEGAPLPHLIVAERQTAGRGRRGRTWASPFSENIYYSLALRIDGGAQHLEGLSLVVGLSVIEVLKTLDISGAGLKWPNDVLVGNRKVAGILVELMGDPAGVCQVVIGIGINVNMLANETVDQPWTSLQAETGGLVDRSALAIALSRRLAWDLQKHRKEGFSSFRQAWERNHLWEGREVSLFSGSQVIEGRALGVDDVGALRLDLDGREQTFSGGELSLRLRNDS